MRTAAGNAPRIALAAAVALLTASCEHPPGLRWRGPVVQAPAACADFTVSIYFDAGSAAVTREAADLIRAAAVRARGCAVGGVDVLGLAEVEGDPDATLALSKARADAVTRALARRGFKTVQFQVGAAGDAGAMAGPGRAQPLRRRADVTFHLAAKPPEANRA